MGRMRWLATNTIMQTCQRSEAFPVSPSQVRLSFSPRQPIVLQPISPGSRTLNIRPSTPALRGGVLALLAAVLFGLSTPLVQLFGRGLGAFTTAALLYAGAAIVAMFMRLPPEREARLRRSDLSRMLAMAGFGAVVGPVALAWGLQRTSGSSASLMLTLEALFTAVLARRLYGETMNKRLGAAMLLLAGGVALVLEQGLAGNAQLLGLLAVLVATAAWGVDNTLSRGVAKRDPGQIVLVKASLGTSATLALALVAGEPVPSATAAGALLAIGATG